MISWHYVQVDEDTTLIEGSLDGLAPGPHALVIHQYGDTTKGVESVGGVFGVEGGETAGSETEKAGHLGSVVADAEGHATIPSRVIDGRVYILSTHFI